MNHGDLENLILRTIDRWMQGRYTERHALVTAYDPNNFLAKVTFQPAGQESGWLPIETGHVGKNFGITVGLTPGDGKTTGDQVIVRYQEGDFESAKIVQRVHNTEDTPPPTQSGEIVLYTKFKKSGADEDGPQGGQGGTGQQIYLKNDGSLTLTDGNGALCFFDGNGNIKIKGKLMQIDVDTYTLVASQDVGISGGNNVEITAGNVLGVDAGAYTANQGGGSVSDGSVSPPQAPPPIPPFSVPAG